MTRGGHELEPGLFRHAGRSPGRSPQGIGRRRYSHRRGDRRCGWTACRRRSQPPRAERRPVNARREDRKSTRLNSSHSSISYAVFCLKKKKKTRNTFSFLKKKKKNK